jgi:hypothetical protein
MDNVIPVFEPARVPRHRKRRPAPSAAAPVAVLVTSVVGQGDGSARITFSAPVTLNATPPGDTIHFVVEDRDGYAHDLTQDGPDAILAVVDGVPIASNATWTIDPLPPCFDLPAGASMPVPQSGVVE